MGRSRMTYAVICKQPEVGSHISFYISYFQCTVHQVFQVVSLARNHIRYCGGNSLFCLSLGRPFFWSFPCLGGLFGEPPYRNCPQFGFSWRFFFVRKIKAVAFFPTDLTNHSGEVIRLRCTIINVSNVCSWSICNPVNATFFADIGALGSYFIWCCLTTLPEGIDRVSGWPWTVVLTVHPQDSKYDRMDEKTAAGSMTQDAMLYECGFWSLLVDR